MGEAGRVTVGRRFRRARRLDRSRRGVVAVVGTLLALLVFFALFGVFLTQYVPLWMTEDESAFTQQSETSFALLKSNVDLQYSLGGPASLSTPFTLNSQSVPLLAQPTVGTLSFETVGCPAGFYSTNGTPETPSDCVFQHMLMAVGTATHPVTDHPFNDTSDVATVQMTLPNRYYPMTSYTFEDDAVFQTQSSSQQYVVVPPPLNITHFGTNTTVEATYLGLFGNSTVYTSQGTKDVFSALKYSEPYSSAGRFLTSGNVPTLFNFTFEVGTHDVCAWFSFLNATAHTSGLTTTVSATAAYYSLTGPNGASPPPVTTCQAAGVSTYDLTLTLHNISYATVEYAGVTISFTQGGS